MAAKFDCSWDQTAGRWSFKFGGRLYRSKWNGPDGLCDRYGVAQRTKLGSYHAANSWKADTIAAARAAQDAVVSPVVEAFRGLDLGQLRASAADGSKTATAILDVLSGAGGFMVMGVDAPPELDAQAEANLRTVQAGAVPAEVAGGVALVEKLTGRLIADLTATAKGATANPAAGLDHWAAEWVKDMERRGKANGTPSQARINSYRRDVATFRQWVGADVAIADALGTARLRAFFGWVADKEAWSGDYKKRKWSAAKTFARFVAEATDSALSPIVNSRRFNFASADAEPEGFTPAELRAVFQASNDRQKCWWLLMLNCGFYPHDLAELRQEEVDLAHATITRTRSKLQRRGGKGKGRKITWALWPETVAAMRRHRAAEGELWFSTNRGTALVRYHQSQSSTLANMWVRIKRAAEVNKPMRAFRKTGATALRAHPVHRGAVDDYLGNAPHGIADRHYAGTDTAGLAAALDWLRAALDVASL
jgi:integrase